MWCKSASVQIGVVGGDSEREGERKKLFCCWSGLIDFSDVTGTLILIWAINASCWWEDPFSSVYVRVYVYMRFLEGKKMRRGEEGEERG